MKTRFGFTLAMLSVWASTALAQTPFPFSDTVEDTAATHANWTAEGDWAVEATDAHSGNRVWSTSQSGAGLTLAGPLDLSGTSNPQLSLWARIVGGYGSKTLRVDVSTDGGATFTQDEGVLEFGTSVASAGEWVNLQLSLAQHRQANVVLRLRAVQGNGGAPTAYQIDDILVSNAPPAGGIELLNPTNNGMTLSWTASQAADFERYRIVLSTYPSASEFTASQIGLSPKTTVSGRIETRIIDVTERDTTQLRLTDLTFVRTRYYAKIFERDAEGLWNTGSVQAQSQTVFDVGTEVAPFVQRFEGAVHWAADRPWALTQAAKGEAGHSDTTAWEDSPASSGSSNYPASADRWLVARIDLSHVDLPLLRFSHRYTFASGDYAEVAVSTDNASWTTLATFRDAEPFWTQEEYDIRFLAGEDIAFLRFRTVSGPSDERDGWHLDDVEVADQATTPTAFPFVDDVESDSTLTTWIEGSEWSVESTDAHSGNRVWSTSQSGAGLTLAGPLDLSGTSNPVLSLWARIVGGYGSKTLGVDVSTDGGATFTQNEGVLEFGTSVASAGAWVNLQLSLAQHRQANVVLRLRAVQGSGGLPTAFQIDDITVSNAPPVGGIELLSPTNNGMTLSWLPSEATDFERYRIVLSTNPSDAWFTAAQPTVVPTQEVTGRIETRVIDITDAAQTQLVLDDLAFVKTRYYASVFERDQDGLWNTGSVQAQSQTAFDIDTEVAPFVQDFEGTVRWAVDRPWRITQESRGEAGHSDSSAWEDSPAASGSANYLPNADRWLVARVDLSNVERPLLRFSHRYAFASGDYAEVAVSPDNSAWTVLAQFRDTQAFWDQEEFDIRFLAEEDIAFVRFRTVSGYSDQLDGWHLDDVGIVEAGGQNPPTPFPFADDVESEGTLATWIEGNEWSVESTDAHSGNRVWSTSQSGAGLTLAGPLDLSGTSNPVLSLWARIVGGYGGKSLHVDVSTDGGATFTQDEGTLEFGTSVASAGEWVNLQLSLAQHRQANVVLRLRAVQGSGGLPTAYQIDDITIDIAPPDLGDVDGDGTIGPGDAVLVLRHLVGFISLSGNAASAGDVSGNGTLSPLDAVLILQYSVGIITEFPAAGSSKPAATPADAVLAWHEATPSQTGGYVVPLELQGTTPVQAVMLTAQVDGTALVLDGIAHQLPADWQVQAHQAGDEVRVAMAGLTPVDPGLLGALRLSPLREAPEATLSGTAQVDEGRLVDLPAMRVAALPRAYGLAQNHPNPFNPTTQIRFQLPEATRVRLRVYNLVGQQVRTLVDEVRPAGDHHVVWDGRDDGGARVQSGVYLYRLEASGFVETRKMMLVQ